VFRPFLVVVSFKVFLGVSLGLVKGSAGPPFETGPMESF
jgi:hypothetical protein